MTDLDDGDGPDSLRHRRSRRALRRRVNRTPHARRVASIPELDDLLNLPRWLPGESPPLYHPDDDTLWYTPTGQPIRGQINEAALVMHQYQYSGLGTFLRSRPYYRSGTRIVVHTSYLGINRGFSDVVLTWESMVFYGGSPDHRAQIGEAGDHAWRYATPTAALAGHRVISQTIAAAQRERRLNRQRGG